MKRKRSFNNESNNQNDNGLTIRHILQQLSVMISNSEKFKNIVLICKIMQIKEYDWCYFLELSDETGSLTGVMKKSFRKNTFKNNDNVKFYGSLKIGKFSKIELVIEHY